ncbi:HSF-type DNA-binding-domain-containing protein [Suillus americanus]|nr:HSF-type DNA-binding-domain-containing protein [Suillus americanus]
MQDLYTSQYQRAQQWSRPTDYPPQINTTGPTYPQQPSASHSSSSNGSPTEDSPPTSLKVHEQQQPPPPKSEAKPQATFLTKLYALLERPENHHMIRWDPAGEHIIVERPEQLALHVLPSIYRQSRFASFSRQLNIYGFMRKVNLRNVDPAIDDPDASTWSHPTLNRHSPPEVVANFKRRVPPRLPKPRKRDTQEPPSIPPPRSAIGMGPVPLTVPSSVGPKGTLPNAGGRARGFSAPGSLTPLNQSSPGWSTTYSHARNLPPLTVPSEPIHHNLYNQSHLQPISPAEESPTAQFSAMGPGSGYHHPQHTSNRDMLVPPSQYSYTDSNWQYSPNSTTSNHSGSLSSLLNPPSNNGYGPRPTPTINTSYATYSGVSMHSDNSPPSLSPDSRPTTGYSISSVSSLPYEESPSHHTYHQADYSRPGSSHHRPISPSLSRPPSSSKQYGPSSLSIRRPRRHSQAMSPYPSPYGEHPSNERPSTSPHPADDGNMPRVRSMIQLPSVDSYGFPAGQAEFAYSAVGGAPIDSMDGRSGWGHHQAGQRPSTSASSISAASHTSSSQANTPPLGDGYGAGEADINRFSPDFGFVAMNEHLPPQYTKTVNQL